MFEAYTTTLTTYETDASIAFTDIRHRDCRISTATPTSVRIVTPGRYYVTFHGVGSSDTAASPFTIELYRNDVAVPGAITTITSSAAGDEQTLSLATIINVPPSCCYIDNEVSLRLVVTSEEPGTLSSGNIVIFRLK